MIRAATADDYPAFTTLFRELGVDDPTPSRDRFIADLSGVLMFERDGAVAGYVSFYRLALAGHVRNLVVAPDARNLRIGDALMRAAATRLHASGVDEWHLNVKLGNAPAIRLYERLGMTALHRSAAVRFPWARLGELPVEDAVAAPADGSDDDDLERALDVLGGRLAMARQRPGMVIVQLRDARRAPVGVACFDPAFPGAYTFRVARPGLAAPLLRALEPHAQHAELQILVDEDPDLVAALVAAGGEIRMHTLHYRGALPLA